MAGLRSTSPPALAALVAIALVSAPRPTPASTWWRTYAAPGSDYGLDVAPLPGGGFVAFGDYAGVWLLGLDDDGRLLWERRFQDGRAGAFTPTADGFAATAYVDPGAPSDDLLVFRFDAAAAPRWEYVYQAPGFQYASSIRATADDGLLVASTHYPTASDPGEGWLLRLDAAGSVVWDRVLGGSAADSLAAAHPTADGGAIAAGSTESSGSGAADFWLVKLDSGGVVEWQKTYGGAGYERAADVGPDGSGGYVIAGSQTSSGAPGIWVVSVDATGSVLWQKSYSATRWSSALSIEPVGSGYVVAALLSVSSTLTNAVLLHLDRQGEVVWQQQLGSGDRIRRVHPTPAGDLIAVGDFASRELQVLRLSATGTADLACGLIVPAALVEADTALATLDANVSASALAPVAVAWTSPSAPLNPIRRTRCTDTGCLDPQVAPLQTSVGALPCGGAITTPDSTPALVWTSVAGSTGYAFQAWSGPGCSGSLLRAGTTTGASSTSTDVWPPLADGAYSWQVRATGDGLDTCDSPWTCGCDFSVDTGGVCTDDVFEDDDLCAPARTPCIACAAPETHLLCDPDWVGFDAELGSVWLIETKDLLAGADTVLRLYRPDCTTLVAEDDDGGTGGGSRIVWTADATGPMRVEVSAAGGAYATGPTYGLDLRCIRNCGISWSRTFGTAATEVGHAVAVAVGGGSFVAGEIGGDAWLARLDDGGAIVWQQRFDEATRETRIEALAAAADGGVIAAGRVYCTCPFSADVWVVKVDGAGTRVWERFIGDISLDQAHAIDATTDGGVVVVGESHMSGAGEADLLALKLDAAGATGWLVRLGDGMNQDGLAAAQVLDGGFLIAGSTVLPGNPSTTAPWVVKLSAAGGIVWQKALSGSVPFAGGAGVVPTSDSGGVVLTGGGCLIHLDAAGARVASRCFGFGSALERTLDDGLVVAGAVSDNGGDATLLRLDAGLNPLWLRRYGGVQADGATAIGAMTDGGFLLAGTTESFGTGGSDVWSLRVDRFGGLDSACGLASDGLPTFTAGPTLLPDTTAVVHTGIGAVSRTVVASAAAAVSGEQCPRRTPPGEVSPGGAPSPLVFAGRTTLVWEDGGRSGSSWFNLYRGDLAELRAGGTGACLQADLLLPSATDAATPPAGGCWFYQVTGENPAGEGPALLGPGGPVPPSNPCP